MTPENDNVQSVFESHPKSFLHEASNIVEALTNLQYLTVINASNPEKVKEYMAQVSALLRDLAALLYPVAKIN